MGGEGGNRAKVGRWSTTSGKEGRGGVSEYQSCLGMFQLASHKTVHDGINY